MQTIIVNRIKKNFFRPFMLHPLVFPPLVLFLLRPKTRTMGSILMVSSSKSNSTWIAIVNSGKSCNASQGVAVAFGIARIKAQEGFLYAFFLFCLRKIIFQKPPAHSRWSAQPLFRTVPACILQFFWPYGGRKQVRLSCPCVE